MKEKDTTYHCSEFKHFIRNGYYYQFVKDRKLTPIKHNHDFFEICFIIQGNVTHVINDKTVLMEKNEFLLLSPFDTHYYKSQSSDAYVFSLSITTEKMLRLLSVSELQPNYCKSYTTQNNSIIKDLFQIPLSTYPRQNIIIDIVMMKLFYSMIEYNLQGNNIVPQQLLLAIDSFRKPENINGGVAELAELSHYSKMQLCRLIKKYFGKTPIDLILDIKMNLAKEYLEKTSYSIEKIAYDIGFSSVGQLYSVFKKQYNCTPSKYRKNFRTFS